MRAKKEVATDNKMDKLAAYVDALNEKYKDPEYPEAKLIELGTNFFARAKIERLTSGSIVLDTAIGGGIPLGRIIQISGGFSSSKTTLSLHIVRSFQEAGKVCAFLDAEGSTQPDYMQALGIDVSTLLYSRPESLEEAQNLLIDHQKSGIVNLAVLDTIECLSPMKEYDTDMIEDKRLLMKPVLNSEYFRKNTMASNYLTRRSINDFTLIILNQVRDSPSKYNPEFKPGGRALGFYPSIDIELKRGDWLREGKGVNAPIVGHQVNFRVTKNKTAPRMKTGTLDLYIDNNAQGVKPGHFDRIKELQLEAIRYEVIHRGGAYYTLEDGKKFMGLEALIAHIRSDEELQKSLERRIMEEVQKNI